MLRTSYSQILNSSRDFSVAICDDQCRLDGAGRPHPGPCRRPALRARNPPRSSFPRRKQGDVILLERPLLRRQPSARCHRAPSGLSLTGRRLLWTIVRAHQSDIGGATHGAYNPAATEIWQEGLRIPPILLYEDGRLRADLLEMLADQRSPCARFSRRPRGHDRRRPRRRTWRRTLVRRVRREPLLGEAIEAILDASERRAREPSSRAGRMASSRRRHARR